MKRLKWTTKNFPRILSWNTGCLLGIIIIMVDYDPHITGLCIIPWKTGNNQGTLFSLQKSTHSHPGMEFFFIKNLARDQQKTLKFKQTCFLLKKKQGKNYPTRFLVDQFFLRQLKQLSTSPHSLSTMPPTVRTSPWHLTHLVDLPWLKGERRLFFHRFPWAKKNVTPLICFQTFL